MVPILLPELGTPQAKLGLWLVEVGEPVQQGERIAEVLIPGANVAVLAPAPGRLTHRFVGPNQDLHPGQLLAELQPDQEG